MKMKPSVITPFIEHPKNIFLNEKQLSPSADGNHNLDANNSMTRSTEASNTDVQNQSKSSELPEAATITKTKENPPTQAPIHHEREPSNSNGSRVPHAANSNSDKTQLANEQRAAPQASSPESSNGASNDAFGPPTGDSLSGLGDPSPEIKSWCERWVFDLLQEAIDMSQAAVRSDLESESPSIDFARKLVALRETQLTQMRITKEYLAAKEKTLGVTLNEVEKIKINFICTESFERLLSEIILIDTKELVIPKLLERFKCIAVKVTSETLTNV
jgi:hypothetical protein